MKRFVSKVFAAVLTIAALAAGQSNVWATTKTVTYKITDISQNSNLSAYNIVFTRSGDDPFDASKTTYTCTVPTSSIGQTSGGSGYTSVELADGFQLSLSWSAGSDVRFASNCIRPWTSDKYINYSVSCPNTNYYYVTHVFMTGTESGYQHGMVQPYPHLNERIDYDYDSVWGFSESYMSAASFGQITLSYSDTPTLSIFESAGTNTYNIKSKHDLRHLANYVNNGKNNCNGLTFRQTDHITCDNTYTPIGYYVSFNDKAQFKGTYDGQGNTVSGITVTRTGTTYSNGHIGLFGYIYDGTVQNVVLENSTFIGNDAIGGIVGSNYGTVQNCRVESTVTIKAGTSNAWSHGGIVGYNSSGTVIGCVSAASIQNNGQSTHEYCGGIVGRNSNGTIRNCLYIGSTVEADNYKGAIVGFDDNNKGIFTNNYYTAIDLGGVGANGSSSDQNGARRARTVTLGENIVLVGDETIYDYSGITAIGTDNYALSYNDGSTTTLYSGATQNLTFSYTGEMPAEGYTIMLSVNGVQATDNGNGTFTATMPAADAEVTIGTIVTPWAGSGTPDDPWIIQYPSQLILLASNVNGGNNYEGKYFLQTADLIFDGSENSYISVGDTDHPFKGNYNGSGKTISRINISKPYNSNNPSNSMSVGLFGRLDNGGVVDGIYLKTSTFVGSARVGGIVGWNKGGSVTNCAVESDVTIRGNSNSPHDVGGVVGLFDGGVIDNCFSAANVSGDGWTATNCGGIVGWFKSGNLRNCQVVGATINGDDAGAVVGYLISEGSLSHNYYNACTVNGNTTNIGCGYPPGNNNKIRDITNDDGAVQTAGIPLLDHSSNYYVINTYNGKANQNYTLAGRTLYKDGDWNTLCLPFDVSTTSGILAGDDVQAMTLDTSTSGLDGTTLTLNFTEVSPSGEQGGLIPAGTPFIIKWATPESPATDLVNPTFSGVTLNNSASTEVSFTGGKFVGNYSPVVLPAYDKSKLFMGGGNSLYWPETDITVNAFRAYFELSDGNAQVKSFVLNFGDGEATSIDLTPDPSPKGEGSADAWFSIDGRRLSGKPGKAGIYIHGNRKVVIK